MMKYKVEYSVSDDIWDDIWDDDPEEFNGGEFITNFSEDQKDKYRRAIVASGCLQFRWQSVDVMCKGI